MTAPLRTPEYQAEHRASAAARFAQPKGLGRLLAWFLSEWAAEVPDKTHVPGVWRDYVRWDEDRGSVGGSLLGAPALHGAFRSYTENSDRQTDADGSMARPIHHALVVMAGRTSSGRPFMARVLFQLAHAGGDIGTIALRLGWPEEAARDYLEAALFRLWSVRYCPRRV